MPSGAKKRKALKKKKEQEAFGGSPSDKGFNGHGTFFFFFFDIYTTKLNTVSGIFSSCWILTFY